MMTFFKIINWKINNNSPWEEIQTVLPLLKDNDAIELINHSVKVKLSHEFKNDCNSTPANYIINFIQNSLRHRGTTNIEACYKKIFSGALQIDVNENIIFNTIKMNLADQMIKSLIQIKMSNPQNEFERATIKLQEASLRYSIFKKEQDYSNNYLIFSSDDSMQKVSTAVKNIHNINQMGSQSLNKLKALSTQRSTNQQEKWKVIRSEFIKFQVNLGGLTASADEGEKKYIQSLQKIFDCMIELIDAIYKASSAKEIESLTKDKGTSLAEQTKNLTNLSDAKVSYFQTNLENLLSALRLKGRVDLLSFTVKMGSFLMENMVQTG